MKAVSTGRYVLFGALALAGATLDLATKSWIFRRLGMPGRHESIWLVDDVLGFTTSLNEGALFGIGQGRGLVFCALSVAAILGVCYWLFVAGAAREALLTTALGLVTGGILGNLYDRLGLPGLTWGPDSIHQAGQPVYAVRDFVHFRIEGLIDWPLFNVADSLLVSGAALLVWRAFAENRRRRDSSAEQPTAP
jgi:signal peptidase II